jgi:hypothetical protein
LVAIGCKGRLEMSGGASYARAIARDIEKGAKVMMITEGDNCGA